PSKPPFFARERRDSCDVACLRMLLAHRGADVSEAELLQEVGPMIGGRPLEELVQLAERHGLHAEIRQLDTHQLAELIDRSTFPIDYLDRSPLDRDFQCTRSSQSV